MDALAVDPDAGDVGGGAERERLGEGLGRVVGVGQADSERVAGQRAQPDGVEAHTLRQVADLAQPERAGPRRGREVEQVRRGEEPPVLAQLLDEVGLQALLEQAEPRPGPDVAAQRHPHSGLT